MPVNVDTVYQTVQALANKEQRGYITPQEFNLFANQAQQDIFEQYFYDLNAFRLRTKQMVVEIESSTVGSFNEEHEIGDSQSVIRHKLASTGGVTYNPQQAFNCTTLPTGFLHFGKIQITNPNGDRVTLREINPDEIHDLRGSRWHLAAFTEYVYFEDGFHRIQVHTGASQITSGCSCETITGRPGLAYWGYTIVNEEATYNPATSSNFDLVDSEQPDLVIKILKLAGVSIEDGQLAQIAAAEEQQNLQQENK